MPVRETRRRRAVGGQADLLGDDEARADGEGAGHGQREPDPFVFNHYGGSAASERVSERRGEEESEREAEVVVSLAAG